MAAGLPDSVFSKASLLQGATNPVTDMEQRPPRVPKLAWMMEEEESPGAAPAQETEEVVPFQPAQETAAMDRTQEQDPARGCFCRTLKVPAAFPTQAGPAVTAQPSTALGALHGTALVSCPSFSCQTCKFTECVWQEENSAVGLGTMENGDVYTTDTSAAPLDLLVEKSVPIPEQVPAMVTYIHQWLMANESAEHRLDRTLLDLTEAQPADVVMTLLRVAPSCDRAAMTMWTTIMSSSRTVEAVLQILLDVLGNWPEHSTCTSDGDRTGVFALAATVVMWKILQVPCWPRIAVMYFPRLFVPLLFQVFFSTRDTPEEVEILWKGCQEEHGLATSPNRFAVRTLKSLLCFLQCEDVVMAMERKRGWDTLLCADTQHYAVALLAREMRRASTRLCSGIALHLLQVLSTQELCWDLPAMAFLVEVLRCLDPRECGGSVVKVSSRSLQSECRERRCLALRALLELIDDPSMAEKMWSLTESLMDLLWDKDAEIVGMALITLSFIFLHKYILIPNHIALQLAEALLPFFDTDDPQVQLLSIRLFQDMMEYSTEEREKLLENPVHQSLLPLFFHCHDENPHVAEASRETLLCAAKFLNKRDLKKQVKEEKLWKFAECLLAEDRSRAAEHLRQALPYLDSPQEPLREAAVRFTGMAGRYLRGQKEELQVLNEALQALTRDDSPSQTNTGDQEIFNGRAAEPCSSAASEEPASLQDLQMPWKMRLP